jgi:hypothetical protein
VKVLPLSLSNDVAGSIWRATPTWRPWAQQRSPDPPVIYLTALGTATARTGDFAAAASLTAEAKEVTAATEARLPPFTTLLLVALTGRENEASALIRATIDRAESSGQEASEGELSGPAQAAQRTQAHH